MIVILMIHKEFEEEITKEIARVLFSLVILIPLWIGIQIRKERTGEPVLISLIWYALSLGLSWILYAHLNSDMKEEQLLDYFLLITAAHLIACTLPYLSSGSHMGFWQYNRILLLRILLSAFYSGFLFAGLSIAIVATDQLLGFSVNEKIYADVFIFLAGVFNTWFFLAGIPKDWNEIENDNSYPKGLKIFTQYVLIPLVSIYLIILYIYSAQILSRQEWPVTWVVYLVLGFSISGILALLLTWPLRELPEYTWIRLYSKWYFMALLPLALLLIFTIGRQILHYGITPNRYLTAILSLWLLLMAIYYLIAGLKRIRLLPVSLACICLFAALGGPLSAISVSLRNQKNGLEKLLTEYGALEQGKFSKPVQAIPDSTRHTIESKIQFLQNYGDTALIISYLPDNISETDSLYEVLEKTEPYAVRQKLMEIIGGSPDIHADPESNYYFSAADSILEISGFEYMAEFQYYRGQDENKLISYDFPVLISYESDPPGINLQDADEEILNIPLLPYLERWKIKSKSKTLFSPSDLVIQVQTQKHDVRIYFKSIHLRRDAANRLRPEDFSGKILIGRKSGVLFNK